MDILFFPINSSFIVKKDFVKKIDPNIDSQKEIFVIDKKDFTIDEVLEMIHPSYKKIFENSSSKKLLSLLPSLLKKPCELKIFQKTISLNNECMIRNKLMYSMFPFFSEYFTNHEQKKDIVVFHETGTVIKNISYDKVSEKKVFVAIIFHKNVMDNLSVINIILPLIKEINIDGFTLIKKNNNCENIFIDNLLTVKESQKKKIGSIRNISSFFNFSSKRKKRKKKKNKIFINNFSSEDNDIVNNILNLENEMLKIVEKINNNGFYSVYCEKNKKMLVIDNIEVQECLDEEKETEENSYFVKEVSLTISKLLY